MDTTDLHDIFLLMKQRNPRGIELLCRGYFRKIYGIAFSVTKNREVSEDAVQNVFLKLYGLSVGLFPREHELSWLYTVVRNEALQLLRKEKPVVRLDDAFALPCRYDDISRYIDMEYYESVVKGLNEKQRRIVTLKILGGFTHREISEIMGCPVGTVQWTYNTSVKKLRRILEALSGTVVLLLCLFIGSVSLLWGDIASSVAPEWDEWRFLPAAVFSVVAGVYFAVSVVFWICFFKAEKIPRKRKQKGTRKAS